MDQPLTLGDVVTNSQLPCRACREPDYQAEIEVMNILPETLAHSPQSVLQKLVEVAQELCRADSAGISLLEKQGRRGGVYMGSLSGSLEGSYQRHDAGKTIPCGITIDRDATQLMYLPERC